MLRYNYSSDFYVNNRNLKFVSMGKRIILASRYTVQQSDFLDAVSGFSENIFMSGVQMITRRGFPFLMEFNRLIIRIRDAGLMTRIKNEFEFNNTYLNRIAKNRQPERGKFYIEVLICLANLKNIFYFLYVFIYLTFIISIFALILRIADFINLISGQLPNWWL